MATVTDYLIKIQDLTKQNLDILKVINESFFTNKSHLKSTISVLHMLSRRFYHLKTK